MNKKVVCRTSHQRDATAIRSRHCKGRPTHYVLVGKRKTVEYLCAKCSLDHLESKPLEDDMIVLRDKWEATAGMEADK
jgi:hypothetical protein